MPSGKSSQVLVLGATGATGKHVVKQLLAKEYTVKVIVRSKSRLLDALELPEEGNKLLDVTEASLNDMSAEEIKNSLTSVDTVVSCLGHTLDTNGLFGRPCYWVSDTARRFVEAAEGGKIKFIWMGSDGVAHPDDDIRGLLERSIIFLLRHLINPHKDNELVASYFLQLPTDQNIEWVVVRPTDLTDGEVSSYKVYEKPPGSLFGSGSISRANVAKFMVDLIDKDGNVMWNQYKSKMPVIHDGEPVQEKQ